MRLIPNASSIQPDRHSVFCGRSIVRPDDAVEKSLLSTYAWRLINSAADSSLRPAISFAAPGIIGSPVFARNSLCCRAAVGKYKGL